MEFPIDKFIIKKTITSSDIKAATYIDLTIPGTGEILIEDIILKTDSTGLVGALGTEDLVISTTNSKGASVVLEEAVANLGANKTVDLSSASVAGQKTVLEEGAKLRLNSTNGDLSGSGTIDIYIFASKASKPASIY